MLISVGWLPPYWCPSRRLLRSRLEGRGLVTRSKIAPKTGAASPPMARDRDQRWFAPSPGWAAELRRHRDRSGDGPSERRHLPRNRDDNLVHMFAARAQQPVPLAQPQLGLPRDGAHLGGYVLQAELENVPTEVRAIAWKAQLDRKSTRLNSSHSSISYAVFCLKKKKKTQNAHV